MTTAAASPRYGERAAERAGRILDDVRRLVQVETPSADHAAVARGAEEVATLLEERLGRAPRREVLGGVTHLVWGSPRPRVVLLCHQDTVWPLGTLAQLPCTVEDGVLRGPGCFDMLTGLVMGVHALALCAQTLGPRVLEEVSVVVTGDEELGSPTSRDLLLRESEGAQAVLVLEASSGTKGAVKVGRKGVSRYRVVVHGRAAHSGLEPEKGVNAGIELARLVLRVVELADRRVGTTITPTTLAGGTTANTVPALAHVEVDVRCRTVAEQERVDTALRALTPHHPEARVVVEGGVNRPPMERGAAEGLLARLVRVAAGLGHPAPVAVEVGGASDGNFTAAAGLPTLDGLGAVGGGAHADDEHVLVATIAPRTALLAALLHDLLDD